MTFKKKNLPKKIKKVKDFKSIKKGSTEYCNTRLLFCYLN